MWSLFEYCIARSQTPQERLPIVHHPFTLYSYTHLCFNAPASSFGSRGRLYATLQQQGLANERQISAQLQSERAAPLYEALVPSGTLPIKAIRHCSTMPSHNRTARNSPSRRKGDPERVTQELWRARMSRSSLNTELCAVIGAGGLSYGRFTQRPSISCQNLAAADLTQHYGDLQLCYVKPS